jgi:glycosyl transferase family 8
MNAVMVTVDECHANFLQLFLASLHRHYPDHPEVLACLDGWSAQAKQRLQGCFPFVSCVDVTELEWTAGPPMKHQEVFNHPVMYARWAALTKRFDQYDTILYLDVDMLVLGPLDELFASAEMRAFQETYPEKDKLVFRDRISPDLQQLLVADGLQHHRWDVTANAGVIILPRNVRTAAHLTEAQRITRRYGPHLMWGDQSMLNIWMARHQLSVVHDCRFNYQLRLLLNLDCPCCRFRDVRILHFNGRRPDRFRLMAAAFCASTFVPFGTTMLPALLRLLASPAWQRLRGYRMRESIWRFVVERALAAAVARS